MKKIIPLILLSILCVNAFSQEIKVNLRVSPAIMTNRVTDENNADNKTVSNNGAKFAFIVGPNVDLYFADNYAFSTGLYFESTSIGGKIDDYSFDRSLQYLQAPVGFKVFTNELATNMKLYFQLGGTFNIKISEKLKSSSVSNDPAADKNIVSPFDMGLYIGAGLNYNIAESNAFFAGLYYNRGLTNIISNSNYKKAMHMRVDLIGLEVGFTF